MPGTKLEALIWASSVEDQQRVLATFDKVMGKERVGRTETTARNLVVSFWQRGLEGLTAEGQSAA